jgi:hypothetical protein
VSISKRVSLGARRSALVATLVLIVAVVGGLMTTPAGAASVTPQFSVVTPTSTSSIPGVDASVSCTGPTFCMAVGGHGNSVAAQQWNGSAWVSSPVHNGSLLESQLTGVSCVSSSFCLAVGNDTSSDYTSSSVLVEQWNGSTWTLVATSSAPSDSYLAGVDCSSPTFCMAAGWINAALPTAYLPMALTFNGSTVANAPPVNLPAATGSFFYGVNCASSTYCLAGGAGYTGTSGADQAFSELWNGQSWSVLSTPDSAPTAYTYIESLKCLGPSWCVAVGESESLGSHYQPFVLWWNGSKWTIGSMPATAIYTDVNSVSCTSEASCVAVGSDYVAGQPTIIFQWNGSSWSQVASPTAPVAGINSLFGVSCVAGASCQAVGSVGSDVLIASAPTTFPGYREVASDGGLFSFGGAPFFGSMGGHHLNQPVVGMAATNDRQGYFEVASDGGLFAFGDANFQGSMGGSHLNKPVVGMATDPATGGYWEVASDGGLFSFGAPFFGSMGGQHLNAPIVGMVATPDGQGYWEVASDGGIFAFGDARFFGSMGGQHLNQPVVGITATPSGQGYFEVASDGGLFAFGDATFQGSMGGKHLNKPIVGMATDPATGGYWEVASDGGLFAFGATFAGSMGGQILNKPIVGMAA